MSAAGESVAMLLPVTAIAAPDAGEGGLFETPIASWEPRLGSVLKLRWARWNGQGRKAYAN